MTYHIKLKEYACPKCQISYIPFEEGSKCPECGFYDPEAVEYHNFANEVIQSMKAHKTQFGRYTPDAWYTGSVAESLQSESFRFFDHLEAGTSGDFSQMLSLVQFEKEYEQKYLREFLTAIHERYKADSWFPGRKKSFISSLFQYLSQFFPW